MNKHTFTYTIYKPNNWIPSEEEIKFYKNDANKEYNLYRFSEFKNKILNKLSEFTNKINLDRDERIKLKEFKQKTIDSLDFMKPGPAGFSPYYPRRLNNGGKF